MIRKLLENRVGYLSNKEFAKVSGIVNDDLKFNRIGFGKYTTLNYVMDIAERSVVVFRKSA